MAKSFNGSTLTFAGASVGTIQNITDNNTGAEIDCTGAGDSQHVFEVGLPNISVNCTVLGAASSVSVGGTGALAVSFNDGEVRSIGTAICTSKVKSGAVDGAITTSLTFRPYAS